LAKGAERMSKVTGLYSKSSSDALACSPQVNAAETSSPATPSLDSVQGDEWAACAVPAGARAAANRSANEGDDLIQAVQSKSEGGCGLPSIHKLQQNSEPVAIAPAALRAPGVRAFQSTASAAAPSAPSTQRPLSRSSWWRVALVAVAVAFCAAVYAHTLHILPPAPYVLFLVSVCRAASCNYCCIAFSKKRSRPWLSSPLHPDSVTGHSHIRYAPL
jgi:anti-sigma-K factor RskA